MNQLPTTIQSIKAIEIVKRVGLVRSYADLARQIDVLPQILSDVKSGNRNLPPEKIGNLVKAYHLSYKFIHNDELPVFDPAGPNSVYNAIAESSDKDILTRLTELEANQKVIMEALKKHSLIP